MLALDNIISQINLVDIYKTFQPSTKEFTFKAAHEIFSKTDHIPENKVFLKIYTKIEITLCTLTAVD